MVERVSEPLTKFLFDSLKTKRVIDESFIAEIIEIVINALGLNDYVKSYKINNKPWDGSKRIKTAKYNYSTKRIVFNLQTTLEFYKYNSKNLRIDSWEIVAIIYDCVMQALLHELEHAYQVKKMKQKDKDLESTILVCTNIPVLLYDQYEELIEKGMTEQEIYDLTDNANQISKIYYTYSPIERLAEYYSHKTMATIIKELRMLPNISYYECLNLCQSLLRGYSLNITPTKYYFEMLGISELWPKINREGLNLDIESRASLGLSISEEEYQYLIDTTDTLKRMIIK